MYRIDTVDENVFKTFLSVNDSEYIDAIIQNNVATLVTNTSEIFAALQLDCITINENSDEGLQIRIPRSLLMNLLTVGHLLINTTGGIVTIEFYELDEQSNVEKSCVASFQKQDIWSADYKDKLELLHQMSTSNTLASAPKYNLKELGSLIRVGSKYKSIIDCNHNIACISLSNTCKVYRRIESPMNFSIAASALAVLAKVSLEVFDYKNYVGVNSGGFTILCTKSRGNSNEDFTLILEEKSSFKAKADLRYLYKFFDKMKVSTDNIVINLDAGSSVIREGTKCFSIPIMIRELVKAPNLTECEFTISKSLIDVLSRVLQKNIVEICNKRTFVQLCSNDVYVIFRS